MSPFSFDRDFPKVLKFNVIHLLSCKISVALQLAKHLKVLYLNKR